MKKIFIGLLAIGLYAALFAHQPKFIMDRQPTQENPIMIGKPDVSKAFYGDLNGAPEYFEFALKDSLNFYMNILVPDIPLYRDCRFSAELLDSSQSLIYLLDSSQTVWKPFYEKYGKDNYLMGPEVRVPLGKGIYFIRVFNAANQGRYSLATGEKESFPLLEIWRAIWVMPKLKKRFFSYHQTNGPLYSDGDVQLTTTQDLTDLLRRNPDFSVNQYGIQSRGSTGIAYYLDGFRVLDSNLIDVGSAQSVDLAVTSSNPAYGNVGSGLVNVTTPIGGTYGRVYYQSDDLPGFTRYNMGENRYAAYLGIGPTGSGLSANISGRLMTTNSYQRALYRIPSPGMDDNVMGRLRWLFPDRVSNLSVMAVKGRVQYIAWNPYDDDQGNDWKYAEHPPMRKFKSIGFGASADWRVKPTALVSVRAGSFAYEIFDGNRDYAWEENNGRRWYDDYRLKAEHLIKYLRDETLPYRQVILDSVIQYHLPPDYYSLTARRMSPYGTSGLFCTAGDYPLWAYQRLENRQIGMDCLWYPTKVLGIKIGGGYAGDQGFIALNQRPGFIYTSWLYSKTKPDGIVSFHVQPGISYGPLSVSVGIRLDYSWYYEYQYDSSGMPIFDPYVKRVKLDLSPSLGSVVRLTQNMEIFANAGAYHHALRHEPFENQPAELINVDAGYRFKLENMLLFELNPYRRTLSDFVVNKTSLASYYGENIYNNSYSYPFHIDQANVYGIAGRIKVNIGALALLLAYNAQRVTGGDIVYYYDPYGDSVLMERIYPLSYDRDNAMNLQITYEFSSYHPIRLLRDIAWTLVVSNQGGLRYTPLDYRENYLRDPNSARMPDWSNIDLYLRKGIITGPLRLTLSAAFTNLLNKRQIIDIYPMTGDPLNQGESDPPLDEFGYLTFTSSWYSPQADFNHDGLMTAVENRDEYIRARNDLYNDPIHFNPGFGFRLGMGLEF